MVIDRIRHGGEERLQPVTSALQSVAVGLLDEHLRHCVTEAISEARPDAPDKIAEAT